jgi:hypothetical protein
MNSKSVAVAERAAPAPPGACPLCHTVEAGITGATLAEGASWRCARCGQRWDGTRLATAAAYAAKA